jgi:hypothetical protein
MGPCVAPIVVAWRPCLSFNVCICCRPAGRYKDNLELHKVSRVMVGEVACVQLRSTGADLARLLSTTTFNGFPVVERVNRIVDGKTVSSSDKFVGMVMRAHLERLVLALMAYVGTQRCGWLASFALHHLRRVFRAANRLVPRGG